jgi:hypothetical protein
MVAALLVVTFIPKKVFNNQLSCRCQVRLRLFVCKASGHTQHPHAKSANLVLFISICSALLRCYCRVHDTVGLRILSELVRTLKCLAFEFARRRFSALAFFKTLIVEYMFFQRGAEMRRLRDQSSQLPPLHNDSWNGSDVCMHP